jgi:hypothetical protein
MSVVLYSVFLPQFKQVFSTLSIASAIPLHFWLHVVANLTDLNAEPHILHVLLGILAFLVKCFSAMHCLQ